MLVTIPAVALTLAGALALVNIWLSVRVGRVRTAEKVFVGDGGNERVIRRMRAHANFAENAWLIFGLVLVIELATGTSIWLWIAAGLFVLGRIGHGLGMDGLRGGRVAGTAITLVLQLALAIWAIAIPLTAHHTVGAPVVDTLVPQG